MEKQILRMLEAYIEGALAVQPNYNSEHMNGYFAGIRAIKEHIRFEKEITGLIPKEESRIIVVE
jgi:basic membrane lipoprotein Med (substrate-binding protein (PBP1-ABC) superfamily)